MAKVPFARFRTGIFAAMLLSCAWTGIADRLPVRERISEGLVDLGLCGVVSCTLLGLLTHLLAQKKLDYKWSWRLDRCEARIMGCEAVAPFFACDDGCEHAAPMRAPRRPRRILQAVQDDEA